MEGLATVGITAMALPSKQQDGDANGKPAAGGIGRSGFPVHASHRPGAGPSSHARAPRGEEGHVLCGDDVLAKRAVEDFRIGVGTRAGHDLEVLLEFSVTLPSAVMTTRRDL